MSPYTLFKLALLASTSAAALVARRQAERWLRQPPSAPLARSTP